jgi:hypothetical protein
MSGFMAQWSGLVRWNGRSNADFVCGYVLVRWIGRMNAWTDYGRGERMIMRWL